MRAQILRIFEELGGVARTSFTLSKLLVTLLVAFLIGLLIYFVYKKSFDSVLYNRNFNVSLVVVSLITAVIIISITANLALSLGMVGALSIVRFRTAIKDPMDIAFMFWAIGVGIATGAGYYSTAVIGSVAIASVLLAFRSLKTRSRTPYLLIINYTAEYSDSIDKSLAKLPGYKLKSKTVTRQGIELTLEVSVTEDESAFLERILEVDGVRDASLVNFPGEYAP